MAGRVALIQESNAVESTSHVTMLCLDKTGTLTTNRLVSNSLIPLGNPGMEKEDLRSALGEFAASMSAQDRTISAIQRTYPGKSRAYSEHVLFSSEHKWSALRYSEHESADVFLLSAPEVIGVNFPAWDTPSKQVKNWTSQPQRDARALRPGNECTCRAQLL